MALKVLLTISCLSLSKSVSAKDMTGFIVGGNFSTIGEFPHVAFLQIRCKPNSTSYCGSSIINQALLLTAAHCVNDCKDKKTYSIKAYTGHVRKYKGDEYEVIGFKIHENYNPKDFTNDIALLVLQKNIKFKKHVKRILLMKNLPEFTSAKIAGWGWIDFGPGGIGKFDNFANKPSARVDNRVCLAAAKVSLGLETFSEDQNTKTDVLKHTYQTVISYKKCYQKLLWTPVGTICGFNPSGSHPQRGDSGSALVIHGNIQLGLASYFRRRVSNTTLVYTNVSYFYDWILSSTRDLYCTYKDKRIRLDEDAENATESTTTRPPLHDFML